jgi:RES domain-containing protein
VWYASDREQTAWAELFRHFTSAGVDPFEVRRRVGAAEVHGLQVLDLCEASVRTALGVGYNDLVGDDHAKSQEVAQWARSEHYEGLLAPSAAVHGGKTLVVFAAGMHRLELGESRVRRPPPRLADLLRVVRLRGDIPAAVRSYLEGLANLGAEKVRAARRRR